jgi:predicted Ser/Thr protein kinase
MGEEDRETEDRETVEALRPDDPRQVGPYQVAGRLGEGGQGTVFFGRGSAGEAVAVKLLHGRLASDEGARDRLVREVAAAKRVARFSTAQVLDAGVAGDRLYVVAEYVDGPSLQHLVAAEGPRVGGALERLAVSTATALSAIHHAGIVHRDLKPANVLLGPDGPRVIDFGIAWVLDDTATVGGHAIGTPAYLAPEQLGDGLVGPAADVFAWAVTMVYAATGTPAFGCDAVPAVIGRILHARPDLSGVPEPLRNVVGACLAKDPAARPTAWQVLDRLVDHAHLAPPAAALPVAAAGPPPPGRKGRRRLALVVAALVAVVAVGTGTAFGTGLFDAAKPKIFMTTPHGCDLLSSATLRRWVSESPRRRDDDNGATYTGFTTRTGCEWESQRDAALFALLTIGVTVEHDNTNGTTDIAKGVDRATDMQRSDRRSATRHPTSDDGTSTMSDGPVVDLAGVGDEAFTTSYRAQYHDGSYDAQTVKIEARTRNALVSVEYTSGRHTGPHRMTAPDLADARAGAVAVARDIVEHLADCGACTRGAAR